MSDKPYLEALRTYWKKHQAFPSMAKLCDVVGLSSTSSVFALVGRLTEAGYLERTEGRIAPSRKFFARPFVSSAQSGRAEPDGQDAVELLSIDDYLIENPNRTELCRVDDDSMKDAGILEGDIVTVERNALTMVGDIVVAIVNDKRSIMTLRFDRNEDYYLEPANAAHSRISVDSRIEILGKVIGSFRRLRR